MHALRKYKLGALIAERFGGDRGPFLKTTKLSKGRLSQLLDPDEPFGEVAARNLEKRLRLDPGYFDTLDARTLQFAMAFERPPDPLKARWEQIAAALTPPPGPPEGPNS